MPETNHLDHNVSPRTRKLAYGLICCLLWSTSSLSAAEWSVPVAGNSFRSAPHPEGRGLRRGGVLAWDDPTEEYVIYFHVDRPATLELQLDARVPEGQSSLTAHVDQQELKAPLTGPEFALHQLGRVELAQAGYVRVALRGTTKTGNVFAEIRNLKVTSDTADLALAYVKTNDGNMFYWGRRGPSVHLSYQTPKDVQLQWGYSEITVPTGQDVIGSYFMANGFAEGYFGIQVNSDKERRVLFSVWSPFQTDNPRDIPADQRIACLGRGPDVHIGEFGNEGAGGQSYLVFPWKAGITYAFLTEVKPFGPEHTDYTCWFCDQAQQNWRLVASFRRPKTTTHLKGFHSFLENFNPATGHLTRQAHYGNVWVGDVSGKWHECTQARFSVDATGGGRHRLDFQGGVVDDSFYLKNCGFFNETSKAGTVFTRPSHASHPPQLDVTKLPRP
ncbi:MAG: DUF3472 domain-containing protein [Planctomycetes bacterium]|nr:DUF3472 domain-containing protein [Planctomycetota bacterium]